MMYHFQTIRKKSLPSKRGFTLVEVLVAMFVFSLMMVTVSQVFASAFSGYRFTRAVERDLENAQFFINILAKELRTSSVVSAAGNQQFVQFFDHSQGKCFRYRIDTLRLQVASAASTGVASGASPCNTMGFGSFTTISTGSVSGSFRVTPSATVGGPATVVGKVTIALDIFESAAHHARMQTTVSLRDFGNIGL
ncbi:MAG: prepilin-type N-terminal cleavage/methylation domain-containing protein [Candidatus Moraniibacteriota bacterium]